MSTDESKPLVSLTRTIPLENSCVYGEMTNADGVHLVYTLEPPWQDNEPYQSCLPAGVYETKVYESPTKGTVFRLDDKDTQPRKAIEIHKGNGPSQTEGCILVGKACGTLVIEDTVEPAVLYSKAAMRKLLDAYPKGFILHIEDKT